jgi:hypothetical protein
LGDAGVNFQGLLILRRGGSLSSAYCRNWPVCDIAALRDNAPLNRGACAYLMAAVCIEYLTRG